MYQFLLKSFFQFPYMFSALWQSTLNWFTALLYIVPTPPIQHDGPFSMYELFFVPQFVIHHQIQWPYNADMFFPLLTVDTCQVGCQRYGVLQGFVLLTAAVLVWLVTISQITKAIHRGGSKYFLRGPAFEKGGVFVRIKGSDPDPPPDPPLPSALNWQVECYWYYYFPLLLFHWHGIV